MKKPFLLFSLLTVLAIPVTKPVQANALIDFFFPSLKEKGPDPMETLQAPFALDPNAPAPAVRPDPSKAVLPENTTPLDMPHRDNQEISNWVTTAISEALTFDKKDYLQDLQNDMKYFTPEAQEQFKAFIEANNIIKVLETGKFQMRGFVTDVPLLLNQGAVDGSYRWLYEVPMMISYLEHGVRDYKNVEPVNQKLVVTIQVGRTADATGQGILIERWDAKIQKMDKN